LAEAFAGEAIFDGGFDAGFDGGFDGCFDGVLDLDGAFFWGDVTWLPALLRTGDDFADCPQEKSSPPIRDCKRENFKLSQKKIIAATIFSFKSLQQRYTGRGRKLGLTCLVSRFVASFDSSSSSRLLVSGLWRSAGSGRPPAFRLPALPACLSVLSAAAPATIRWPRVMSVCVEGGSAGERGFVFEHEFYLNMNCIEICIFKYI
jgi:hypothetical protein